MEEDQTHRESNNVVLFRLAISNSLKRIAESVSKDDFLNILTVMKSKPNVGDKLHKAMVQELYRNMNDDWEYIFTESNMEETLKKVSKLTDANSSVHEEVWRPPGDVALHLRSLDAQVIEEESKKLSMRVQKMEEENAMLMHKITTRRLKVFDLQNDIMLSLKKSPIAIKLLEERLEHSEQCLQLLQDYKSSMPRL